MSLSSFLVTMNNTSRCPSCGRKLKRTPDSYYCFRCRTHYPHEDIDVEVVE